MEQAGRVRSDQGVQAQLHRFFQAGLSDGHGKAWGLDGKSPAEAATEPVRLQGDHFEAFHGAEEFQRFFFDSEAAHEVASHVEPHPGVERGGRNSPDPQVLHEEFGELPEAGAKTGVPREEGGEFVADHGHTGAGRGHDHLFSFESLEKGFAHGGGKIGKARVVGGLAAAGLALGHHHLVAQFLQKTDRGLPHLREGVVHETGNEEGDSQKSLSIPPSKRGGRGCYGGLFPWIQRKNGGGFMSRSVLVSSFFLFSASFLFSSMPSAAQEKAPEKLLTTAEASGFKRTGTTTEVWTFLKELCRRTEDARLEVMGRSPQGREIPLVVAGRPLPEGPVPREGRQRPVVYLQANIHAGEVAGKEALQILLRRILLEGDLPGVLDKVVLLVCPDFNTDGNDAISTRNRPWQNGPEGGVGTRYNGQGLDLNRDALKLESREMRALLSKVILPWDPDLLMDCHTTDGSLHVHPLEAEGPITASMDGTLRNWNRNVFLPAVFAWVKKERGFDFLPYGFFLNRRDPSKGWGTFPPLPRYLTNYIGVRGRLSVLSEVYVFKDFKTRVEATLALARGILRETALRGDRVLALVEGAGERARLLASRGGRFGVEFRTVPRKEPVEVRGYAEKGGGRGGRSWKERLAAAGPLKKWRIPFLSEFQTTRDVPVPKGWLLPPASEGIVSLLRRHGLEAKRLSGPAEFKVREFMVAEISRRRRPFQGHRMVRLRGTYEEVQVRAPAGSWFVSSETPLCLLACWLLEPESPDGLTTWGFFDKWLKEGAPHPVLAVAGPGSKN